MTSKVPDGNLRIKHTARSLRYRAAKTQVEKHESGGNEGSSFNLQAVTAHARLLTAVIARAATCMRCQQRRSRLPSLPPELRLERSIFRRQVLKIVDALKPSNEGRPAEEVPNRLPRLERPAGLPMIRTVAHVPTAGANSNTNDGMKKCIECDRVDGPLMVRRCVGRSIDGVSCGYLVCALCAPFHHCDILLQRLQRGSEAAASSSGSGPVQTSCPIVYPTRATIASVQGIIKQTADVLVLTTADVMAANHSATQ